MDLCNGFYFLLLCTLCSGKAYSKTCVVRLVPISHASYLLLLLDKLLKKLRLRVSINVVFIDLLGTYDF